ncbi:MAG: glycosyltransferase family 2 protein [Anaerolineae bacterium]
MGPTISVILVTCNGRPDLEGCLDSLRQTLPPATEVVVVDNGSTDESAALVRERMPEARLLVNGTNRGFAAACNQGAAVAKGEILTFLNQDTRTETGWLEALAAPFEDPTVGLTTPTILWMDEPERVQSCGQDVHYTGLVFARNFGVLRVSLSGARPVDVAAVSGAAFAVRRSVWEELGGFCEAFYMYYEETDLSWRARRAGYRCLHVPDSIVYHAGRLDRPSPLALYCSFRNRWLMVGRNWGGWTLFLLMPGLLLADLAEWGLALARGWPGIRARARALFWVLTHGRTLLRLRREARSGGGVGDAAILADRTWRLTPRVVTGGRIGPLLTALCEALFYLNWRLGMGIL